MPELPVFWEKELRLAAAARAENRMLREALGVSGATRLLDLIARLRSELESRSVDPGTDMCLSCDGPLYGHAPDCPLRAALNEAAQLVLNNDDP